MIDGKYWDAAHLLSYGCHGNVVDGKRNIGKSYGMMRRACARRVRNHEGMVWFRFTEDDAKMKLSEFGGEKWQKLWIRYGYNPKDFRRYGNRILMKIGNDWKPLIRYFGLSEWESARDNDDPEEKFIFFDEFIVSNERLRRYNGQPAKNFLDAWISLRRGKDRCPFLLAGNPEKGVDWFTPALGITDRRTPEAIRIYKTSEEIQDICRDGDYNLDKIAIEWTTNPLGQSSGGKQSGRVSAVPDGLLMRRRGNERIYGNFDLLAGFFSIWYAGDFMIVDTVKGQAPVVRQFPDGNADTVVYTQQIKRNLVYLREFWRAGRIRYANPDAWSRFMQTSGKLI